MCVCVCVCRWEMERGMCMCGGVTEGEIKIEGCNKSVSVTYELRERWRDVCMCVDG